MQFFGTFWREPAHILSCGNGGYLVKTEQNPCDSLLCLSFPSAANGKGKRYVYKPDRGVSATGLVVLPVDFYFQHRKKMSCIPVNQEMFDYQETFIQGNGSNGSLALNLRLQRYSVRGVGTASEECPLLKHNSTISVLSSRAGWIRVPWSSAVVFCSTFQMMSSHLASRAALAGL